MLIDWSQGCFYLNDTVPLEGVWTFYIYSLKNKCGSSAHFCFICFQLCSPQPSLMTWSLPQPKTTVLKSLTRTLWTGSWNRPLLSVRSLSQLFDIVCFLCHWHGRNINWFDPIKNFFLPGSFQETWVLRHFLYHLDMLIAICSRNNFIFKI